MNTLKRFLAAGATACALASASGQTVFYDDFESGLGAWAVDSPPAIVVSDHNAVPTTGQRSLYFSSNAGKVHHNLGREVSGDACVTWYIYDDTMVRIYGEVRGYSGSGYNDGALEGLYAAGKYTSVTAPEVYDATKYQGRIVLPGGVSEWFNLNLPGAPSRSPGWHRFDIQRQASGLVRFYVDGMLARAKTTASVFAWDCVSLGLGAGTTPSDAWIDGVSVSQATPTLRLNRAGELVTPALSGLWPFNNYQLQLSDGLTGWTNHGSAFIATEASMDYPESWNVNGLSRLFFRLQVTP